MAIRCLLLNETNKIVDYAYLEYPDSGGVELVCFSAETADVYHVGDSIRFQFERRFDKVFDAVVIEIADGKFELDHVRYIGAILQEDVRVGVDFPGMLTFETEGVRYGYDIDIKDISSGGVGFYCESNLSMNQTYEYVVDWGMEPIVVDIKLLRKEKINDEIYSYGCEFLNMHPNEERILRGAVFYIQTKKYRDKRREKK